LSGDGGERPLKILRVVARLVLSRGLANALGALGSGQFVSFEGHVLTALGNITPSH
jgi:hypothetical protein